MKNFKRMFLMILLTICVCGCTSNVLELDKSIEIKEMRAISELATVECYFHNVAKSDQLTNKAWFEFWKKENIRFWIEYEGVVTVGVKVEDLNVEVKGENVKITLPKAIVLDAKIEDSTLNKDSFIYDEKSEKPTAAQETKAFEVAQQEMINAANSNKTLLASAEDNAKELLENYVNSIGEVVGVKYKIEWVNSEIME